ncbi:MAG TPA: alpha/beta hydrolase [Solirubrobacteraceae bacterium]
MTLTFRQRVEFRIARVLAALPPRAQVWLSRRKPVRLDGQTLEPEIQLTLAVLERQGNPPIEWMSPTEARAVTRRQAAVAGGPPLPVSAVRDLTIDTAAGPIRARHYAPAEPGGPHPLLVFFHGGGWVIGDIDTHDGACRLLCRHAGLHVLSVDYRLAPEHPFPAAIEDGRAAFAWATAHAGELGADPARIAVGGDSAGGNIAAVTAWQAARDGGPAPTFQLLIYPATDASTRYRSQDLFGEGFFLTQSEMDWFYDHYAAAVDPADPRLSILCADDLSALAPALVVTAGFDPLRDEGEAYARALREAGNVVALRRFAGLIHGFFNATGVSRVARDAVVETAGATRALLETVATPAAVGAD